MIPYCKRVWASPSWFSVTLPPATTTTNITTLTSHSLGQRWTSTVIRSLRRGVPLEKISCPEFVDRWNTVSPNRTAAWCNVGVWKPNLGALDSPQARLSQSLPTTSNHVRTFYIARYTFPTTRPSSNLDPHTQLVNWKKRKSKRNQQDMKKKIDKTKTSIFFDWNIQFGQNWIQVVAEQDNFTGQMVMLAGFFQKAQVKFETCYADVITPLLRGQSDTSNVVSQLG